jgi:alanyl-tRNA synthetase
MGQAFPELVSQKILIEKVIKRRRNLHFYKTLEFGLKRIDHVCIELTNSTKGTVN